MMHIFREKFVFLLGICFLMFTLQHAPTCVLAVYKNLGKESIYVVLGHPGPRPLAPAPGRGNEPIYALLGHSTNPSDRMKMPLPPTPVEGIRHFPTGAPPNPNRHLKPGYRNGLAQVPPAVPPRSPRRAPLGRPRVSRSF
uniref:Uncharacterized protein n=1 Tax=Rhipicephalus appendiculatus TaxID=34631 RepID=A0A131YDJ5_RHIAP